MSIQELREERKAKAKAARNLLDDNTGEKWSKKVSDQVDALYADIDKLDAQLERHEKQMELEATIEDGRKPSPSTLPETQDNEVTAAYTSWLVNGLDGMTDEQRETIATLRASVGNAQTAGTGAGGGFTVPTETVADVLEATAALGGVRNLATVRRTAGGNSIEWPTVDETAVEGELVAESGSASVGDVDFGQVTIGAYKYSSKVVVVPFELLQDSAIDVQGLVNGLLGQRLGRITNRHLTVGTGTNQPKGVVTGATVGKTGASGQVDSVIIDDLIDLEHSVDPSYRMNASWMFHDTTLKIIKKLKDADLRPIWLPGVSSKEPNEILGRGYEINQHMAEMAADAESIVFGDLSHYMVRDVMDVTLFRFDDSAYVSKGQIGFLAWMRTDGNHISAGAPIKTYKNAAA